MRLSRKVSCHFRKKAVGFALFAMLGACTHQESPTREKYKQLLKLPQSEQGARYSQLSPAEQVDLYLYGVEHYRPSDYFFARYLEGADLATINVMVARLRASTSPDNTFALVYALHGVAALGKTKTTVGGDIRASEACSRYYTVPSPCHQLAKDIDSEFPTIK